MENITKYMEKMFPYINQELFDNELTKPEFFSLENDQEITDIYSGYNYSVNSIYGVCFPVEDHYIIGINNACTKKDVFCTLVHELIHVWQFENHKFVGHSGWFLVYCRKAIDRFPPQLYQ